MTTLLPCWRNDAHNVTVTFSRTQSKPYNGRFFVKVVDSGFITSSCLLLGRLNPLMDTGRPNSATSNNIKFVDWPLMGGLLHLVQRGGDWAGPQPAQAPSRCTKCNSPPINCLCTNYCIVVQWSVTLRF